ncbi:ML domain-containing protein [Aspergillus homomorphus CBS 101889]|uniref:Phosphatidylglycerol/phosphatidylinositol transfer protein n=1 Tax=Aspergillus homomorphus (strain CBS 101889) TaxID=1450537 RepID=A0A395IBB2_ASPHC|nr:Phosphatidylglycerol/phosphatidylinositol transfer protein precursor (PG/PI-TP) [Aspergillus homomorphus CBS 101889]RAL16413.1 Phosphatidylglycerol/phosphatidylinositol transfer protein precursor (PG/PI-TP) [Aspergillus homomorphus CBS 101889]
MKFLSIAAAALCAAPFSVTARSIDFFSSQSPIVANGIPVEGDNPLEYCANPSDDVLKIEKVDLSPNPPLPGRTLTIEASGTLKQPVEQGAYVLIEVKYGLITLIRQKVDLCEQLSNVDLECPLDKGDLVLRKQVDLPSQIPPGKYTVHADVQSVNDKRITCLEAHNIEFKRG